MAAQTPERRGVLYKKLESMMTFPEINEIGLEDVDRNLLILTLPEVNDKDVLKEVLSHNLIEERFKDPKVKGFGKLNIIIADKIIKFLYIFSEEILLMLHFSFLHLQSNLSSLQNYSHYLQDISILFLFL